MTARYKIKTFNSKRAQKELTLWHLSFLSSRKNLEGLDNSIHTVIILDLQKTFDTIDDNILFDNELCTIGLWSLSISGSNHTHLTELLL